MKNLKVNAKIMLAFCVVALFIAIQGIGSFVLQLQSGGDMLSSVSTLIFMAIALAVCMLIGTFLSKLVIKSFNTLLSRVENSTDKLQMELGQLANSSEILAEGSTRQAAAIEETSATTNEAASSISQTAENTRQAAAFASQAKVAAQEGLGRMTGMVNSMEDLKTSSDTIAKIVKTIDDIAFQTNLLAINATVEAARAGGDAGRSFGVVAEEVRNLAQRSAKAAADTTHIIDNNIKLTNEGRDISLEVQESLDGISVEIEKLDGIIAEINAASEEQSLGVKQINAAMSQMEKVTQQNAASAEESASGANELMRELGEVQKVLGAARKLVAKPAGAGGTSASKSKAAAKPAATTSRASAPAAPRPAAAPAAQRSYVIPATDDYASDDDVSVPLSRPMSTKEQEYEKIIPLDSDNDF